MPQSLANIFVHIIFSTKNRSEYLHDPEIVGACQAYINRVLQDLESPLIAIGGTANHVHLLLRQSRNRSLADLVGEVKRHSSKFLKTLSESLRSFAWQGGYAAFSVSISSLPRVKKYILSQEEHHRRMDFKAELLNMLKRQGIPYDERYLWD